MGYLTVISETGFPHSACLFEYNGKAEWYGFKPKVPKAPRGAGYVDRTDRSPHIKDSVKFAIADAKLAQVIAQLLTKYEGLTYSVGTGPDCVNFSVDAAQWCGLKTPPRPNLFPGNLVTNLARLNANLVQ
ncbi:hypothetical protein [Roseofilum sp. Guam]|uniref:hypothetical protein n=1 Tax=Roseofilum sp. Guam TaxID=2821502 RepID=UPI001AFEEFC0|nr:hypothetical protein [Roseofilum sp. Guam]MBP0027204.1 hypothetical protein [Roseofilum sp. Guam]